MGSVSEILQHDHPLLRQTAQPVADGADPQVQAVCRRLVDWCQRAHGVGLAAPQIGISQQIIVVASHPNPRYPDAPTMTPTVLINPTLLAHSDDRVLGWEGCLSVPQQRGQVWRYRTVEVAYTDPQGRPQRAVWHDFVARIFQHEADHLIGRLFLDRLDAAHPPCPEMVYHQRFLKKTGQPETLE